MGGPPAGVAARRAGVAAARRAGAVAARRSCAHSSRCSPAASRRLPRAPRRAWRVRSCPGRPRWSWTRSPRRAMRSSTSVSCASPSLCVAVDYAGNVVTSSDPAGGAAAWSVRPRQRPPTKSSPCRAWRRRLCVAGNAAGNVLTSTDPTGGAPAWTLTSVDPKGRGIHGVSCPTASLCVAVDYQGSVLTSTDPTGGAGAWSAAAIDLSPTGSNTYWRCCCSFSSVFFLNRRAGGCGNTTRACRGACRRQSRVESLCKEQNRGVRETRSGEHSGDAARHDFHRGVALHHQ